MSEARWLHPEWGPALLLLCAAAWLAVGLARALARRRRRRLGPGVRPGLTLARDGALLLALACIALALLGPRLGQREVRVPASGIDVTFLIDVSRSMDARDVPPSRLQRARRAVEELLARLGPRDRAALAVFASRGVVLAPLTPDRGALVELLRALDSSLIVPAGSNLAAGVREAVSAFEPGSARPRVLFVLSDGEDPEQQGATGLGAALRGEVRVLAAALGSEAGAPILDQDVPLRDATGAAVVTRRRLEPLQRLAGATGGRVFAGDAWGSFDIAGATAAIRRDAGQRSGELVTRRVPAVRFALLSALAFALLSLEGLGGVRRRRPGTFWLALPAAWLLGAAPGEPSDPAELPLRPAVGTPRALIELGLAQLERARPAAAERAFLAAALTARDPSLAALAYYDLGVTALERGALERARGAFLDALALEPADRQARFNLEWTQQALARGEANPARPPPEPSAEPRASPPPGPPETQAREPAAPEPEALDQEQLRIWLERVPDDPGFALRAAARRARGERSHEAPAW